MVLFFLPFTSRRSLSLQHCLGNHCTCPGTELGLEHPCKMPNCGRLHLEMDLQEL